MAGDTAETLARSAVYKLLSVAFLPPAEWTPRVFSGLEPILDVLPDGHRTILGPIAWDLVGARNEPREAEYTRLFGVGLAATPYETEYDPLATARKGHRLADLAGFYQAFGVRLADGRAEFPDHIATLLEFMAILLLKVAHARAEAREEAQAVSEDAARKFLADHLGWWTPAFADRVEAATEDGFYRFAARLLRGFLLAECRFLGVEPLPLAAAPRQNPSPLTCPFAGCPGVPDAEPPAAPNP
jgi:TorA maturation chaperone TorD